MLILWAIFPTHVGLTPRAVLSKKSLVNIPHACGVNSVKFVIMPRGAAIFPTHVGLIPPTPMLISLSIVIFPMHVGLIP